MTKRIFHLALLVPFVAAGLPREAAAQEDLRPNIILMVSDDYGFPYYGFMMERLRAEIKGRKLGACSAPWTSNECADDFDPGAKTSGVNGCDDGPGAACQMKVETPNLDTLANEGVVFEHGYVSDSACTPAYRSLMSGLNLRDLANVTSEGQSLVSPSCSNGSVQSLPELLASFDYNTLLAGKSWLTNPEALFNDFVCNDTGTSCQTNDPDIRSTASPTVGEDQPLTLLKEFLKAQDARPKPGEGRRPWFVMWSPLTPHQSYNNHPSHIVGDFDHVETTNRNHMTVNNFGHDNFRKYLEAIKYYDERIGELVEFLQLLESSECDPDPLHDKSEQIDFEANDPSAGEQPPKCREDGAGNPLPGDPERYDGFRSNTLIVYVTDNPSGLNMGKGHFTENGLRTPIILNYPGHIAPVPDDHIVRREALVGAIDIFPTIYDYARPPETPMRTFPDAMSLRGIAEDPSTYPSAWRRYFFSNATADGEISVLDSIPAHYIEDQDGNAPRSGRFKVYTDDDVGTTFTALKGVANVTVDPFEELFAKKPATFVTSGNLCKVKYGPEAGSLNGKSTVQHLRGIIKGWTQCSQACRDWLVIDKLKNEACSDGEIAAPPPPPGCSPIAPACKDPAPVDFVSTCAS